MYALLVLAIVSVCDGTSLINAYKDIQTKTKVELSSIEIFCNLNDIVVLATPVVNCDEVLYQLHKPNGEILKIDYTLKPKISRFYNTVSSKEGYNTEKSNIIVKYISKDVKTIYPKKMYKVLTVDQSESKMDDNIKAEATLMNENDFMIGPLLEEDHGNWLLSVHCKDVDGEWIEIFQVISIIVTRSVAMNRKTIMLREGDTFDLSFQYPIRYLETCELVVPYSSIDRFYDRNRIKLNTCGYVISNVTKEDHGTWKVIGVGRIVYEGQVFLSVVNKETPDAIMKAYNVLNADDPSGDHNDGHHNSNDHNVSYNNGNNHSDGYHNGNNHSDGHHNKTNRRYGYNNNNNDDGYYGGNIHNSGYRRANYHNDGYNSDNVHNY